MEHFYQTLSKQGSDFINKLFNQNVIISEKIDGQAFTSQWVDGKWLFYKRDLKKPINEYDRTMSDSYEFVIDFFNKIDGNKLNLKDGQIFSCEYVISRKPNVISYDKIPKNNLILLNSGFLKNGKIFNTIDDIDILNKYADELDIEKPGILFNGKLSKNQKQDLINFLNTPSSELIEKFKTNSFTKYIFSIIDTKRKTTYLQNSLDKDIEGIVFNFNNGEILAKLVDPFFEQQAKEKAANRVAAKKENKFEVFIIDFLNFVNTKNLQKYSENNNSKYVEYVKIISKLFVEFFESDKKRIEKYSDFEEEYELNNAETQSQLKISNKFLGDFEYKFINKNKNISRLFATALSKLKFDKKIIDKNIKELFLIYQNNIKKIINESRLNNFNDFQLLKLFEGFELGGEDITLIIGRFQPLTLGHMKMVDESYKTNKNKIFFVIPRSKSGAKISDQLTDEIFKELIKTDKRIAGYLFWDSGAMISKIMAELRPKYEISLIVCGTDREKDYSRQIDYMKNKNFVIHKNLDLLVIKRTDDDISASKVRETIKNNDIKTFKNLTPVFVHQFWNKLQIELNKH